MTEGESSGQVQTSDERRATSKGPRAGRPSLPPDVGGLLAAVAADRDGRPDALRVWDRENRPRLDTALRESGFDGALADEAVVTIAERSLRAVTSHRAVGDEVAWMSYVAASVRIAPHRVAIAEKRLFVSLVKVRAERQSSEERRAEAHEMILRVARELPSPHAEIVMRRGTLGLRL